jgi:hypothetical protein
MRRFLILLLALAITGSAFARDPGAARFRTVPPERISDPSYSERRTPGDVEVVIVNLGRGGLMTFELDRKPVARLYRREALRLYLRPGRYRFGVVPVLYAILPSTSEIFADVRAERRQVYRIFQSAGFTSSGGNAVYDIALAEERRRQ